MPLESNKKLLTTIKDNSNFFQKNFENKNEKALKHSERDLIKHLNRINTIFAELAYLRKQLYSLNIKKKLKAKEIKEKKDISEHIAFIENEEEYLLKERENTKAILKEAGRLVWEDYKAEKNLPYSFEEIISNEKHKRYFFNEGIIATYNIRFVPRILSDNIKKVFPSNPKDEFMEARALKRHFIIHEGGTNSGKTYNSIKRLMAAESGLYLAPLRLLALEIFDKLNSNNVPCHLKTGEEELLVDFAKHTASTVEKVDLRGEYEVVVIDEAQMLADTQRGAAWTRALLGVKAKEIHVCCALNATEILKTIIEDCEDTYEIVTHKRDTELLVEEDNFNFPQSVLEGDALIVFSRRSVLTIAATLEERNIPCSVIYGSLPPETRRLQFQKFLNKESKVLVSTDAIGMGVNLPIKRIVFLEDEKFDGIDVRPLLSSEVKQIAGRAGRKGIYEVGYVNSIYSESKNRINKYLTCKETPIDKVFIAPTEDILKVSEADLETKLKVWSDIEPDVDFYIKLNMDRLIALINVINVTGYRKKLSDYEIFKAINIPFDEGERDLMLLWKDYIYYLTNASSELEKPDCDSNELYSLEVYYKKIDLYYSFSKTFNFSIDEQWIKEERTKIAKLIDKYLREKIKKYGKTCRHCGNALSWNSPHNICDKCHSKLYRNRYGFSYEDEEYE